MAIWTVQLTYVMISGAYGLRDLSQFIFVILGKHQKKRAELQVRTWSVNGEPSSLSNEEGSKEA